jgi:hypothetical protein
MLSKGFQMLQLFSFLFSQYLGRRVVTSAS